MVRPEYSGGGLVNLVASLTEACGGAPRHPPLSLLPAAALSGARAIVLVIIDGLGDHFLRRHGVGSELERRRQGALTSVFPSTTASAITTTYTGCTPREHGLTGWYTLFGEAACVAAPLPFHSRGDKLPLRARGVRGADLYAALSLFDGLAAQPIVVSHRSIIDSEYNRHHCGRAARRAYDDLDGFVRETEAAVKSPPHGRKFVYAYWPEFDALSHRHGCESAEVRAQFAALDAAFGELLRRLAGAECAVVASADHGFLDSAPAESLELADAPGLAALLRYPLCGERRVAFCHVQPGRVDEFIARATDWLGERAQVRESRVLVEDGWFGAGATHPRFAERVGDVTLLMNACYTIKDWTPGEARHLHLGNHGGASAEEMMVPLVIAKT